MSKMSFKQQFVFKYCNLLIKRFLKRNVELKLYFSYYFYQISNNLDQISVKMI